VRGCSRPTSPPHFALAVVADIGKTAILISHRFSSVRMADRILVLADGKVEAAGTHEELILQSGSIRRAVRVAGRDRPRML